MNLNLVSTIPLNGRPWDVQSFNYLGTPGLLVSDFDNDRILFVDPASGAPPITFYQGGGSGELHKPRQISIKASNGNVLVCGDSLNHGLYEFDKVTGQQVSFLNYASFGQNNSLPRGVQELDNGNLFITEAGCFVYDPVNVTWSQIANAWGRYVSRVDNLPTVFPFCNPGNVNSSGTSVSIAGSWQGNSLHLEATGGPPNQFGYFLVAPTTHTEYSPALGQGILCLAMSGQYSAGRYNISNTNMNSLGRFDSAGVLNNLVGTSTSGTGFDVPAALPIAGYSTIMAGELWHFQLWHRDSPNSNTSNGLSARF
ncbi:MAG: hypothetical protein GY930_00345 [bacterium]|nr:hypothetical protein [bacterium]